MKNVKRLIVLIITLVLLGIAGYFGFHYLNMTGAQTYVVPPVPVEVTTVVQNEIPQIIHAIGNVDANLQIDISPQNGGHIKQILFHNGQHVKKGMILVRMNDATVKAQLDSAQAALKLTKIKLQRLHLLSRKSAVSQQTLDEAVSDYDQAQAQVAEAQAAVKYTILRAPFSGFVGERKVDAGQFIKAGDNITTLVDLHQVRVSYQIPARFKPKLRLGQQMFVKVAAYKGKKFAGVVTYISPYVDPITRTVTVQAIVPNHDDKLAPGMFAEITQTMGVNKNSLVVPTSSLVPTITGTLVYRVVNNRAVATDVKVGIYWNQQAEVLSGLQSGTTIVMAGQQRLHDGRQVKIVPNTWKGYAK